eukprot:g4799.t1
MTTIVINRCDTASLLLDNNDEWGSISRGMILFLSFTKECAFDSIPETVKSILRIPLSPESPTGQWGDGGKLLSISDFCKLGNDVKIPDILIVPQAGLTSKFTRKKGLQYHKQMSQSKAKLYYDFLCLEIRKQVMMEASSNLNVKGKKVKNKPLSPEVPPFLFFETDPVFKGQFSSFQDDGMPTRMANGEELSKNKSKKIAKVLNAHRIRHEEFLRENPNAREIVEKQVLDAKEKMKNVKLKTENDNDEENSSVKLEKAVSNAEMEIKEMYEKCDAKRRLPKFVNGTFGNRQVS